MGLACGCRRATVRARIGGWRSTEVGFRASLWPGGCATPRPMGAVLRQRESHLHTSIYVARWLRVPSCAAQDIHSSVGGPHRGFSNAKAMKCTVLSQSICVLSRQSRCLADPAPMTFQVMRYYYQLSGRWRQWAAAQASSWEIAPSHRGSSRSQLSEDAVVLLRMNQD